MYAFKDIDIRGNRKNAAVASAEKQFECSREILFSAINWIFYYREGSNENTQSRMRRPWSYIMMQEKKLRAQYPQRYNNFFPLLSPPSSDPEVTGAFFQNDCRIFPILLSHFSNFTVAFFQNECRTLMKFTDAFFENECRIF